jgi:formamidase
VRVSVDRSRHLQAEPGSGHNRWHPDLDPIAFITPGEELTLETREGSDGQLTRESSHTSIRDFDFGLTHPLTGPVYVEGADPGDLLEVELLGFESADFGVTTVIPGFGFLADLFPDPYLVKWEITGGLARSEELPGVSVPGDVFPGVVGVAPSRDRMEQFRRREEEIARRGGPVAGEFPERAMPPEAARGLRTIPPRETGGNLDVRQLVAGSKLLLPVEVPGALFSIGDLHFAQGDGESCGSGIEVAGAATLCFRIVKDSQWRPRFPAYETPARPARAAFATTGIPVQDAMDLTVAAREALIEMIDYLVAVRGFERSAAYCLCSAVVDLRLSEVVDVPNPVVSALVPLDIFNG